MKTAKELRDRAEGLLTIAGFTQTEHCRGQLLMLAGYYEQMAEREERREHQANERRSRISPRVEQQELRQLLNVSA